MSRGAMRKKRRSSPRKMTAPQIVRLINNCILLYSGEEVIASLPREDVPLQVNSAVPLQVNSALLQVKAALRVLHFLKDAATRKTPL